jgi:sensor histidine kinase YesM
MNMNDLRKQLAPLLTKNIELIAGAFVLTSLLLSASSGSLIATLLGTIFSVVFSAFLLAIFYRIGGGTIFLSNGVQVVASTVNSANTAEIIRGDTDELLEAILNHELDKVQKLLSFGLDLDTPNRHGVVPIELARQLQAEEVLALYTEKRK